MSEHCRKCHFHTDKVFVETDGDNVEPYDELPEANGEASAGTVDKYSRGNHVHPKDFVPTKVSELENDSGFSVNLIATYDEILALKNTSKLKVNSKYIITDYCTIYKTEDEKTFGNAESEYPSDVYAIVLTATSENEFDENVQIITPYSDATFAGKYDITKIEELGSEHKGTIIQLKDDKGNILPYDFYNVRFLNEDLGGYYYTFSKSDGSRNDAIENFIVKSSVFGGNIFFTTFKNAVILIDKFENNFFSEEIEVDNIEISGLDLFGLEVRMPEIEFNYHLKYLRHELLVIKYSYWDVDTLAWQYLDLVDTGNGYYGYGY